MLFRSYMISGRPILQAIEAGNDLVADSKCGITLRPEDPQALADAVAQMMSWSQSERDEAGKRGRDYILRHHDYRNLARQFLEVMGCGRPEGMVAPRGTGDLQPA